MTPDEQSLLRSYAAGPRIWDAASLLPAVISLANQGLIEPCPGELRAAYQLTEQGRHALGELGQA